MEAPLKTKTYPPEADGTTMCGHCPVLCRIHPGGTGACKMYANRNGEITRVRPLAVPGVLQIEEALEPAEERAIRRPLIYGLGAGTEYPDFVPAPGIVEASVDGIDVVTCVTEVPLSYCSVKVKIDTNLDIGHEGAPLYRDGKLVGHVTTEEYGAKMLAVGGVHLISQKGGIHAARTMADICNRERVSLQVAGGATLELQVEEPPVVNGVADTRMRVGCGSATLGIFGPLLAEVADEVLVIDPHITGLLTEHAVGRALGLKYSGVTPVGRRSSIGRYFGNPGPGWGGTNILRPEDAIKRIDMSKAWPGVTIFVVETNGGQAALLQVQADGSLRGIPLTEKAIRTRDLIAESSEPALVSAIFYGGVGGSARAGISRAPMTVNRAVHSGRMRLTVCGAPTHLLPGGNIIFGVDVARVPAGVFYVTPTPAIIMPVEYTTTRQVFEQIQGRQETLRQLQPFLAERQWETL